MESVKFSTRKFFFLIYLIQSMSGQYQFLPLLAKMGKERPPGGGFGLKARCFSRTQQGEFGRFFLVGFSAKRNEMKGRKVWPGFSAGVGNFFWSGFDGVR